MGEFKIEKGLPVPMRPGARKFPFGEMEIGDSFFVPGAKIATVMTLARRASLRTGYKFTGRTMDGGVRCWRVE